MYIFSYKLNYLLVHYIYKYIFLLFIKMYIFLLEKTDRHFFFFLELGDELRFQILTLKQK